MTWARMSRLLESTDGITPTQQINRIARELENFDAPNLLKILSLQYEVNNIGLVRAKKWMAKIFNVFDDEIDGYVNAHNDLGEAIYYLDFSKEEESTFTLQGIVRLLEIDCSKIDSNQFKLIEEAILHMSPNERRWFIRYWLRTPRNGINEGLVAKIMAKHYDKKLAEVKKHLTFNSINIVSSHYDMKENPPTNLFHGTFVAPMLAKEVPMKKWPTNKIVDYKYDGNRYQIHKQDDNVIIFNRKGKVVTSQFPDVVEVVRNYEIKSVILDGEIYPIDNYGNPIEHKHMGTRVHSKNVAEAVDKVKVKWVIFDCLKLNDRTIMDLPYSDRLECFKDLPDQAHRMTEGEDVLAFYNRAINDGFEGIIVKDASIPYEAGKRSIGWAKYKPPRIELDVVITGARYGEGAKANVFASFDIAVSSPNGFIGVGSVGTGFSDGDLIKLTNTLRRNVENYDNKTYHVSPVVVLEVSADLVSRDSQGNLGLRFPRCKRIRDDKFVADINTLEDVEALE